MANKRLFTKEQEELVVSLYKIKTHKEIANILGNNFSEAQVRGWLNNNGYKKGHQSIFTEEEQNFIKNNYNDLTYSEIAKILNKDVHAIRSWGRTNCGNKSQRIYYDEENNRVKKSAKFQYNRHYFDLIKTSNQAYWLGFIFADGYITQYGELGIELQKSDVSHLEKFLKELDNKDVMIRYRDKHHVIANNKKASDVETCYIKLSSQDIVSGLINNGIIFNKSKCNIFPKVEDDLFFDFLRGYIDGDGCIYLGKILQVNITSATSEVLSYIKDKLALYGINSNIYQELEHKYRIYINGMYAHKLLDKIYCNSSVENRLDRKYKKYLESTSHLAEKSA